MQKAYMYILECSDGTYYTGVQPGSTKDLEKSVKEHNDGEGGDYTRKRLPVKLVHHEMYLSAVDASYRKKQVESLSRKNKEVLINGKYKDLPD